MRWIGDVVYSKNSDGAGFGGRPWMALDTAKLGSLATCMGGQAMFGGPGFLTGLESGAFDMLDELRRQGLVLERVGTETVRGVSTIRWSRSTSSCHPIGSSRK